MATGNAKRFTEIGVSPRLAVEYAKQITAGVGNVRRLVELGEVPGAAKLIAQVISGGAVGNNRLAELGVIPRVIRELKAQVGSAASLLALNSKMVAIADSIGNAYDERSLWYEWMLTKIGQKAARDPNTFTGNGNTYGQWRVGRGGIRTDQMRADTLTTAGTGNNAGGTNPNAGVPAYDWIAAGSSYKPLVHFYNVGTNDIPGGSVATAATIQNIADQNATMFAGGSKVGFVGTILKRNDATFTGGNPTNETNRLAVNAGIRAMASSKLIVIDFENSAWDPSIHTVDGLHPNVLGAQVLGFYAATVVAPYFVATDYIDTYVNDPGNILAASTRATFQTAGGTVSAPYTGTSAGGFSAQVGDAGAGLPATISTNGTGDTKDLRSDWNNTYTGQSVLHRATANASTIQTTEFVEALVRLEITGTGMLTAQVTGNPTGGGATTSTLTSKTAGTDYEIPAGIYYLKSIAKKPTAGSPPYTVDLRAYTLTGGATTGSARFTKVIVQKMPPMVASA